MSSTLEVNRQLLEHRLELAIGDSDSLYAGIEGDYRLRVPVCGFSSALVGNWQADKGADSILVISRPQLVFAPKMEHVFVNSATPFGETIWIDPTYSQFMSFVGLDPYLDMNLERSQYPVEKVLMFRPEETDIVMSAFAKFADSFRYVNKFLIENQRLEFLREDGEEPTWFAPLAEVTSSEIKDSFMSIWDPENFGPFEPESVFKDDARRLSVLYLSDVSIIFGAFNN